MLGVNGYQQMSSATRYKSPLSYKPAPNDKHPVLTVKILSSAVTTSSAIIVSSLIGNQMRRNIGNHERVWQGRAETLGAAQVVTY